MATPTIDEDDQDVYVAQLKEVFDSCDSKNQGLLNAEELRILCNKLQLEDQAPELIQQLVGSDKDARVGFEDFKEGFVAVLSETVDGIDSSGDEDDQDDDLENSDASDSDLNYTGGSVKRTKERSWQRHVSGINRDSPADGNTSPDNDLAGPNKAEEVSTGKEPGSQDRIDPITFEAEGQLNQSIAEMENMLDPVSEEEHLKAIWKELGVGTDGYLAMEELAIVCDHIGMEEMNDEELQHLFDKLDVDGDSRVSFQEFLHGLFQHGGPNTPRTPSTPVRPLSTPRQKLRMTLPKDMEDRMHTPSVFISLSGMFSAIDADNSGYAKADTIIELWEALGVAQGSEILEYLQFDLNTKINLTDLSHALEQELREVEETNATYQAAIASYEYELRHLKTNCDQLLGERDKLRNDLSEANSRISLLVKEGDDRVTSLERSREKDLKTMEKKYQDQLKSLQNEIDNERELLISQSSKQKQTLENEIQRLKEEENKLKERLLDSQREIEKMETDISELGDRYDDLDKQNMRQAKELDEFVSLQKKLEEMETNRENILDEQAKFSEQKVHQLEGENTDLKDKNDELTMEIEELRQQLSSNRRSRKGPRDRLLADPKRTGSILSDYAKPHVPQTQSDSATDGNSEDDDSSTTSRRRRQLPQRPSNTDSQESTDFQVKSEETTELKDSVEEHHEEIEKLKRAFSTERKDIEESFKLEISALEEDHQREIKKLEDDKRVAQEAIKSASADDVKRAVAERERELLNSFVNEKQDIAIKAESEKNFLHSQHEEAMTKIREQLRKEFDSELERELHKQKTAFTKELEATVSQDRSTIENEQKLNRDREADMKLMKEELESLHRKKEQLAQQKFEEEKRQLISNYEKELDSYKMSLKEGVNGLDGELKADFEKIVQRHKEELQQSAKADIVDQVNKNLAKEKEKLLREVEKEKVQLKRDSDKDRSELIKDYEREKTTISQALTKEKLDLEKKYQTKIDDLESKLMSERDNLLSEREELHMSLSQEKRIWEREKEAVRDEIEEEIAHEIQSRLEEEFLGQIDQLKEAFGDERFELESRVEMLQRELDDATAHSTSESHHQLQQKLSRLSLEKNKLQEENHSLKDDMVRLKVEQQEREISKQYVGLQSTPPEQEQLKMQISKVEEERDSLKNQLEEANEKIVDTQMQLTLANSQHRREMNATQEENASNVKVSDYNALNAKLVETEQKLSDLEAAMGKRASETTKLLIGTQEKHSSAERKLEAECKELKRNLDKTSELLQDQISKYKNQLQRSTRSDILIKDLYVENSNLIKCLELTERREKDAEKRVFKLEDKCRALNRLLRKIAPAALG